MRWRIQNPGAATCATLSLDEPNKGRSLSSFFHSAFSFLVVFCFSCWQPLFSIRLTLLLFPHQAFFFPPRSFHTRTTYRSISSPLTILESSPVFCCDTILQRTRKGAPPPSPQFIFPALLCLLCLKLVLPLLELPEHRILPRLWSDFRKPSSDGTGGRGSVWDIAQGKQRRQVNEGRRQLCVERHQYSAEAPFAPSSNNIPVIWVSHITLPP